MEIIKIIHIISNLKLGGAEKMLYKLLQNIDREKYQIEVITLTDRGVYGHKIEKLGINVHEIKMSKIPKIRYLYKLRAITKDADIVQTWMYHADFLGYLITRFQKSKKLIWGIRRTSLNPEEIKKSTLLIAKMNMLFSKNVNNIISCSITAKQAHINYGYAEKNIIVIPNGFELNKSYFDKVARKIIRNRLAIENKKVLINVARWNIAKDHDTLIKAYKKIENDSTYLIMIGPGINQENKELLELIMKHNIKHYSLLGPQSHINDYLSASDVYVSSSRSEGFPNVIGEAMACELPCVVTDAGDSSYIVAETGIVVPIEDTEALAKGINQMINLSFTERSKLGKKARNRIEENFDIKNVTKMFEEQYSSRFYDNMPITK